MFASKFLTRTAAIVAVLMLALSGAQPAFATPPANDNFADATVISVLPFSDIVDISEATVEAGEPQPFNPSLQTVWYSFTPSTNAVVTADMAGSDFTDTILAAYQDNGTGIGGLSFLVAAFGVAPLLSTPWRG